MNEQAVKFPSLRLMSRPRHVRNIKEPEKWRLELTRPSNFNRCVLAIDLYAHQPAPDREVHLGHWGYIVEAKEDYYRIEIDQQGEIIGLTFNGKALEAHKRDWLTHSGNGFYEWQVGWSELGERLEASVRRGQTLIFETEANEASLLTRCWPDYDRRYPSSDSMARRILLRLAQEMESLSKALPPDALVLDFGCGNKPYYPFFHGHCADYVGVDIASGLLVDYVYDGSLSLPDDSFHLVICTQVLEHTRDPQKVSSEIWRLLKPGGRAFISAPFCWHYHPWPNDYWRFTGEGLTVLFEQFNELHIERDGDTFHTLLQEFGFLLSRSGYSDPNFLRLLNKLGEESKIFTDDKLPAHFLVWLKK